MHTQPMPESAGTFGPVAAQLHDCPHCKALKCVKLRLWESNCGGWEDERYECTTCGKVWWNEGADA